MNLTKLIGGTYATVIGIGVFAIIVTLNTHITIAGLIAVGATLMVGPFLATRVSTRTPDDYIDRLGFSLVVIGLATAIVCYVVGDTRFASYTGAIFGAVAVLAGFVLMIVKWNILSSNPPPLDPFAREQYDIWIRRKTWLKQKRRILRMQARDRKAPAPANSR